MFDGTENPDIVSSAGLDITVIFPIALWDGSVNQMLPSGPVVIPTGRAFLRRPVTVLKLNWKIGWDGLAALSMPIERLPGSVNQMLSSGPVVIPRGVDPVSPCEYD